jgi:hypothetical protein
VLFECVPGELRLEDGGGLHQKAGWSRGRRLSRKGPHQHLESWSELGDAVRREWRILTRRREITPKMVLAAIVAAGLGWGIAYLADSLPSLLATLE